MINVKLQNQKIYFIDIRDYIKNNLLEAYTANHFNLSIDELKNIMNTEININDPTRNEIGEHHWYDEIMLYYVNNQRIINELVII